MTSEKIQDAIINYDYYTRGQRKILVTLYQLSIDYVATVRVANLAKLTGYSRYMVYKSLKQFESDDILKTLQSGHKSVSLFKLNESKLRAIVDVYNKTLSVINLKHIDT
jgi:DNA-binding MarR family transcriptional regulator